MAESMNDLLKVPPGAVDLSSFDPRAKPGFKGDKRRGKRALENLGPTVSDLQERLYAESRAGGRRSVLLVLQGMDTSGKGGVMRHCGGLLDPQGLQITAFKAPTPSERRHDFLWRIERQVPRPGMVAIFDRSHYEDVLIAKVRGLAPAEEINRRYVAINQFEKRLVDGGITVVKCFLHISREKQKERLLARLDDPTKQWKYNPGDIEERARWDDYQAAYEIALRRCNTKTAPFYLIPSDRKWYRNWAITRLLTDTLEAINPEWPEGDFDIDVEKERLAAT
ncbi:MAG: polyphosphate kinase 2 family protein [Nocardioidaceae bacterium]|nr:polyphosphate kinase 2 family protein [Nocardioidaceae bacterium]